MCIYLLCHVTQHYSFFHMQSFPQATVPSLAVGEATLVRFLSDSMCAKAWPRDHFAGFPVSPLEQIKQEYQVG